MERDFKIVEFSDKFYIQYGKWNKTLFKDMNGDYLEFIRKIDAEN